MPAPHSPRPLPDAVTVTLSDGTAIVVRALVATDRALLSDAFERLSERSRYMRFLSPLPRVPQRILERLLDVDHVDHVALLALHEGRCVGEVRYVRDRDDPAVADLGITVVDAYQRRGLGRALLLSVIDVAAARGVRAFSLDIHPDNDAMAALARSFGARLRRRYGITHGVMTVRPASAVAVALRDAA